MTAAYRRENSEPFFKGSLVEICILSYAPYSFSEKHALKHELMPFFSETRLGKIGRWLLNPQDSSLSEKHISALEQSAAAELAICAAMKNSGRPFAPSVMHIKRAANLQSQMVIFRFHTQRDMLPVQLPESRSGLMLNADTHSARLPQSASCLLREEL